MRRSVFAIAGAASGLLAAGLFIALPCVAQQQGLPRSEKHESKHEIDQLEESWRLAELRANISALSSLLADDYMAITASGTLQTKDQSLALLRSGATRFTSLELSDRKVRFYGVTAVVTSTAQVRGVTPDGDLSGNYRYTRVYVRDAAGKWKIVSFEASRIRETNEHK
jgi:ketosteroid isomerase-like protein